MNCAVHTDTPAAAYCRTCGKALCENCKRDVMGAIYCESCIAQRLHGGQATVPAAVPAPVVTGQPSPGLAGFLGLIPGVGAWYNGQFMKGLIHVFIFCMLIVGWSTTRIGPLEVIFGMLTFFFPIYMAFEAYTTAKARLLGQPAPDPLGLDRIFGIQESPSRPAPDVPGSSVFTPAAPSTAAMTQPQAAPRSNEPIGAVVLIALGVIFLLGNLTRFNVQHFWPLILIGVGLWIAYKRTTLRG